MVYEDEPSGDDGDPDNKVRIGGDDDCDHESLRRVGSDGGYNIYFECTDCEAGIVKFSETNDSEADRQSEVDEELPQEPPSGNDRTHPLIDGLTPDSNGANGHRSEDDGVLDRLESSLRDIFGDDREK